MFCTKCGFNAGNAKFCPKCGNALVKPVSEQPTSAVKNPESTQSVNNTASVTQSVNDSSNSNNSQPSFNQPQAFGQTGNSTFDQAQYGTINQGPKPKKKWPKIVGIVALIVVILGAAGYFAYPYLYSIFSPKAKAVTALKNLGKNADSYVENVLESDALTSADTSVEAVASLQANKITIGDEDYLSYLNVDTLNYTIQSDIEDGEYAGTISLSDGNGDSVITLNFYTDMSYIYFNIPELFTESFKVDYDDVISSNSEYSYIFGALSSTGSIDLSSLSTYSDEIKAVVSDLLTGYNTFVENLKYEKNGNKTFKSENGDIKVTSYEVTITKDALVKGFNAAVDALFNDKEISSYISLLTTFSGTTKADIKSSFEEEVQDFSDATFEMYVNSKKQVVRLSYTEDGTEGYVEFLGKDSLLDYVHAGITDDDGVIDIVYKKNDDTVAFNFTIEVEDSNIDTLSVDIEATKKSDTEVLLDKFNIIGTISDTDIDIELDGNMTTSTFSSLSYTKSSFKSPINVSNITNSQITNLYTELITNANVIEDLFSDELIENLFGTSLSSSSTSIISSEYTGTWTAATTGGTMTLQINEDGTGVYSSDDTQATPVYVTISGGNIRVESQSDSSDYFEYAVSFTDNTMTLIGTAGTITFTKAV